MDVTVSPQGWLAWPGHRVRCALGRGGVRAEKREGDGATPAGLWPVRRALYRPDRLARPATSLVIDPIGPEDGWCDEPKDPLYNRQIRLPYAPSHERLWRDDGLYDALVILGHNDAPPIPGHGSAIFLHIARPDYASTEGCVALALPDLLALLAELGARDRIAVAAS
jgi:L,D-peptidoglycan transpeptidase YkuD (ErfK/YbiS/YcfS/YnhG family)